MKNKKSSPFDFFLNLFSVALLYFIAGAFISLTFSVIDFAFPDPISYYGGSPTWQIAMLLILFPVYIWTVRKNKKLIVENPEKADLKIRKWLIYLTLFVASALILGNLVAVVFRFLEGELTVRFLLKSVTIFAVAGLVLGYYRHVLRGEDDDGGEKHKERAFGAVSSALVLLAIVGGFWVTGSPFQQRLVKLDAQRVSDLSSIQNMVLNHWHMESEVPESLEDLDSFRFSADFFRDPETGEPYEYRVTGERNFELCAVFALDSSERRDRGARSPHPAFPRVPGGISEDWEHGEGRHCFERTLPEPRGENN